MTDAKQEALRQALNYHDAATAITGKKKVSPEQIIATARKFEKFLNGSKAAR